MPTLLETIREQQTAPAERVGPLVIDPAEWAAWDGSDETCRWKWTAWNTWKHERTGEIYEWPAPYVLPECDSSYREVKTQPESPSASKVRKTIPI